MKRTFAALVITCLWLSAALGDVIYKPSETPPITKVTLYKHGLGYFEREGKVQGNALVSMLFREDQMKDILKSFFAVDLGGGRISSIRYDTRDPLSKQLEEVMIKVPEEAALSQFMLQLRGAQINLKVAGESIDGRILGVEPISETQNNTSFTKSYRLVLLTKPGQIRSVDLYSISEFSLTDQSLQKELNRFLDLSLESRKNDRKKIMLSATGEGERKIRIGYLVGMPVWKCSYRVIFDEKKKDSSALLQGWALAENNTEDDWNDVKLSFVAGSPISYIMDLYSPYYVKRAQVQIPGFQDIGVDWNKMSGPDLADEIQLLGPKREKRVTPAQAPTVGTKRAMMAQPGDRLAFKSSKQASEAAGDEDGEEPKSMADILSASQAPGALTAQVGDLFSYEPKERISIPKGQAAMALILSEQISGKKVLFYKADFSPKPLNAFVLQNSSNLTLEAGPVTFFEGSASLGEGILTTTLAPGSQEVVPYASDVIVDIVKNEKSKREPHLSARLVDGILTLTSVEVLTNSWKITNRGKEPAALWLHQPKHSGYRLSKPEKPLKEVGNHYRFEIPLKAAETIDFVVEEKKDIAETVHLAKCSEEQIRFYLSQPSMSKAARTFMKELGDIMAKKALLQREINELNQQSKRLSDEQARIRSNLQALTSNQPKELELRSTWVSALANNEKQLSDTRTKLDNAGSQVAKLEDTLSKKIKEFKEE
ncbi:MAG: DUF4139 domain-containing protein [Desulfomonilaceae bacterium]